MTLRILRSTWEDLQPQCFATAGYRDLVMDCSGSRAKSGMAQRRYVLPRSFPGTPRAVRISRRPFSGPLTFSWPTGGFCSRSVTLAANALMLEQIMIAHGFKPYIGEWWHFSDTQSYPVEHDFEPGKQ